MELILAESIGQAMAFIYALTGNDSFKLMSDGILCSHRTDRGRREVA